VVVARYHDQGRIPMQVLGFVYDQEKGKSYSVQNVNATLGLPIFRIPIDHGTTPNPAGKGEANELSLEYAIRCAISLADNE
jgi:4-phospho-D-threonate 3-dehydrogenase / 4-phospho-D-erythronate 3-dehydrogenase